MHYTTLNYTISLQWDLPEGSGPEVIVDRYILSITPKPASHPISNEVYSTILNVTLNYNIVYSATITAVNCVGESNMVMLSDIKHG